MNQKTISLIVKYMITIFIFLNLISVASASVTYQAGYPRLFASGEHNNLSNTYAELVNQYGATYTQTNILNETSPKVWELKCYFETGVFYLNDTDVIELKLGNGLSGFALSGYFEVNNTEIHSWDIAGQTPKIHPAYSIKIFGNITNSYIYNIGTIFFGYSSVPYVSLNGNVFTNTTIEDAYIGITAVGENLIFDNITIKNGHPVAGNGFRQSYINHSILSNINIINVSDYTSPSSGAYGMQINGHYNTIHDVYINGTSWSGTNLGGTFLNMYNITVDNSGHNGFEFQMRDSIIENVTVRYSESNNFFSAIGLEDNIERVHNITYKNIVGVDTGSGYNVRISEGSSDVLIDGADLTGDGIMVSESQNVTAINITQNAGFAGVYSTFAVAGNIPNTNHAVIDSDFYDNVYKDIWLHDSINTKLLNTEFSKMLISTGDYTINRYFDLLLIDETPISGASIDIMNEVDISFESVNGYANDKTTFYTTSTGHTTFPNTDRANSPAIAEYYRSSDGTYQQFSHTATITTPDDRTVTLTGITPDSSWYRADPNVPTYTITAIIPEVNSVPDITGFAPAEDNPFNTGESKIFRVWTDESLTSMNWYLDGSPVSSGSMNYTWVTTEGGHTIIFEGSNNNGDVSQRWDINGGISGMVLEITEFIPVDTMPDQNNGSTNEFNVTLNQALTSSGWYLDGDSIASDALSLDHTWTHASTHNITFIGFVDNVSVSKTWIVEVADASQTLSLITITPATQTVARNQPFTLSIPITPATPITGAQFNLLYDGSMATVTSVTEGNLLNQNGATTLFSSGTINNAAGAVTNVYGSILSETNVSSQGSMATISITAGSNTGYLNIDLSNVTISDANSVAAPYTLTNAIVLIDTAPVLGSIGAKDVDKDSELTLSTGASDVDGDSLTYSAGNLPAGASFNTATGAFSWTPAAAGTYVVTFEVTDGYISDSEAVTITVNDGNNAPVITTFVPSNSLSFDETDLITIGIIASDADGDALSYTIKIDGVTQSTSSSYVWETDYSSAGIHTIDITVSDGIEQVTDSRTITINDVQPRWDINEDGTVDVLDISIIGQKYDASVGAPYPRWDVNQDGVINVQDMTLAGSHFGETVF